MPIGRVLRTVESQKVRRRMDAAAAELLRRPRLIRVYAAACNLTVGYSRLRDVVSLDQVAAAARVTCTRNVGRDLGELAELGLIGYWPARGRGRRGVLEVPAQFAPEVVLRLGLQATAAPPGPARDQHPPDEDQPRKGPEAEPVSATCPSYNSPKENPPTEDSSPPAAANSATPPQGESAAPIFDINPADVDRVLDRLSNKLRTVPGTPDRCRQAHWIRRLLGRGHVCSDIELALTLALPSVVGSPAGLVEFRAKQLLRDRVGRRAQAVLDAQRYEAQLAAQRAATMAAEAAKPRRYADTPRLPLPVLALLAELPFSTMTALIHRVTDADDPPLITRGAPASPIALAVLEQIHHHVGPSSTITVDDVTGRIGPASCAVSGSRDAGVAAAAESVRRWARLLRDAPRLVEPVDAQPGERLAASAAVCVACGVADGTVEPRPALPLGTASCLACLEQASIDAEEDAA